MAKAKGLDAHAKSVAIRLQEIDTGQYKGALTLLMRTLTIMDQTDIRLHSNVLLDLG